MIPDQPISPGATAITDAIIKMTTVYATESLPATVSSSIFLAGPTPRNREISSWRPEALGILKDLGYSGTVILPEDRSGLWRHSYDDQVLWETKMRSVADIVVFWVPRDMSLDCNGSAQMPALTTNVEFGLDLPTGKVLYGRPPESDKNRYLDQVWRASTGKEPYCTLNSLLTEAVSLLGLGVPRTGDDRNIPLSIFLHGGYSAWVSSKRAAGHQVSGAEHLLSFPNGDAGSTPWLVGALVDIESVEEWRRKSNEIIICRPDISAVAAFHDGAEGLRILLVEEFRSAARTSSGKVIELPGGSSDAHHSFLTTALTELREETGLSIDPARLISVGSRQAAPTLLTHHSHLFTLLLSDAEAAWIDKSVTERLVHGADAHEHITLRFPLVADLGGLEVDWSVLGMVVQAASIAGLGCAIKPFVAAGLHRSD